MTDEAGQPGEKGCQEIGVDDEGNPLGLLPFFFCSRRPFLLFSVSSFVSGEIPGPPFQPLRWKEGLHRSFADFLPLRFAGLLREIPLRYFPVSIVLFQKTESSPLASSPTV